MKYVLRDKNEMKNSGVVGINMIPRDWTVLKLKQLTNQPFQYGLNESAVDNIEGDPRYIRITDVTTSGLLRKDTVKTMRAEKARGYLLQDGDLLFARSGATAGKPLMYRESYGVSCFAGYLIRFVPNRDKLLPRFLDFVSQSAYYENWKNSIFIQATIQNISADKYKELLIPIPPHTEQNYIADFLDEKTVVIDEVVKKKKKQIELLKEKRAALITQAVTKGLDPNVKMKDSGVEWIGRIPEEWNLKKVKYVAPSKDIKRGYDKDNDHYVGLENIVSKLGKVRLPDILHQPESVVNVFGQGDVLFAKLRPYLVKAFTAESAGVCTSELLVMTPREEMVLPKFLLFRILADDFISAVNNSTYGSKMPRASWNFIGNLSVAWPTIPEQELIICTLEAETTLFDKTIGKIHKSIKLIQEYRSSLISHAVTGKIVI